VLERMLICRSVYLLKVVVEKVEELREQREQKQEDVDVKKVIIILY
jgi:hypothetical protein